MVKAEWSSKARQAMKPKVYVETTILSYLAARPSRQPVTAGRQVITRQWWETERKKYNLVVSEVVEAECGRGDAEWASRRRELCISPRRQWKSVNFYLPGTSGISRTLVLAGKWRGFFRTMATPKRPSVRRKSLSEQKPWEDEVLQAVYAERDSYAAENGNNLDQIYADLKRREASSDLRWSDSRPLAKA